MAAPITVNQSTTLVQIDTSVLSNSPHVVLLSNLNSPGSLITIRDTYGGASPSNTILVSTTNGVTFINGGGALSNLYTINQPYGFLTVTPKTSNIWGVTNTFAFPDSSQVANLNAINVSSMNISSIGYIQNAIISTAMISTVSATNVYIQQNLSVGQSTIAHAGFYVCSLRSLNDFIGSANVYAGSTVSSMMANFTSTLTVPYISTTDVWINGGLQTTSSISTSGPMFVGSSISTTGNLAVGASTFIQGQLTVGKAAFFNSISTSASLNVGYETILHSSLTVAQNTFIGGNVSTMSNATIGASLSVMSSLYTQGDTYHASTVLVKDSISTLQDVNIARNLSTLGKAFFGREVYTTSSILVTGSISTLEDINVARNVSVLGNLYVHGSVQFSQKEVDLQDLVVSSVTSQYNISTMSSLIAGGSLNVAGSTLLGGTVSTMSNMNVAGLLSTASTVVVGDSLIVSKTGFFGSNLSTVSSIAAGGNLNVAGATMLQGSLSTLGQAAFFSSLQIQGNVSTMSSMAVACNLDVGNTLTTKNLNLSGSTIVSTLAVTNTVGFGMNISSSVLLYGLLSTSGGMNIGGAISTTNAVVVGSTLNTQFLAVQKGMSVFSNAGFAQDVFAGSSLVVGMSTILNGGFYTQTSAYFADAQFNSNVVIGSPGGLVPNFGSLSNYGQTYLKGNLTVQNGTTTLSNLLQIDNSFGVQRNLISNDTWMSSLTTSSLVVSYYQSTIGNSAFFSSVQVQGGMSVLSSINVEWNGNFTRNLAASTICTNQLTISTLNVIAPSKFSLFVSSSTLHYGLLSSFGQIFTGKEISTMSSLGVGGNANILSNTNIGGILSTYGVAGFGSNVAVLGATTVQGTGFFNTTLVTPLAFASTLQTSSIFASTVTASNIFSSNVFAISTTIQSNLFVPFAYTSSVLASSILTSSLTASNIYASNALVSIAGVSSIMASTMTASSISTVVLAASSMTAPLATFTTLSTVTGNISTVIAQNIGVRCNAPQFAVDVAGIVNASYIYQNGSQYVPTISNLAFSSISTNFALIKNTNVPSYFVTVTTAVSSNLGTMYSGTSFSNMSALTPTFSSGTPTSFTALTFTGTTWYLAASNSATSNSLLYSAPGINTTSPSTWTAVTPVSGTFPSKSINCIVNNGQYVLLAGADAGGLVAKTADFKTFTTATIGATKTVKTLVWTNYLWVAGGTDSATSAGFISYSPDGVSWTAATTTFTNVFSIVWTGYMFVAMGNDPSTNVRYSYDAITWSPATVPTLYSMLSSAPNTVLAWSGKLFVAIQLVNYTSAGRVIYSSNGITWTQSATVPICPTSITWTGSAFVIACGTNGVASTQPNMYSSPDGINWTSATTTTPMSCIPIVKYTQNVLPDLVLDNTSFYTNNQPQFLGNNRTNAVTLLSNAMVLNSLYTDGAGFVGIKNNNPSYNLDVTGSINFTGTLNSNGAPLNLTSAGINSAGYVGINRLSTATYALTVNGSQSNSGDFYAGVVNATQVLVNGAPIVTTASTTQLAVSNPFFTNLTTVCFDPSGNMYVADQGTVRKQTPTGLVTTVAGSTVFPHADGIGANAAFNNIVKMVYDSFSGTIIIADYPNVLCSLSLVTGQVATFVNSLNGVTCVCADGAGTYYASDTTYIYKVTPINVTTVTAPTIIAGSSQGYLNSYSGINAKLRNVSGLSLNTSNTILYIADGNNVIRQLALTAPYAVTTVAGRLPALTNSAAFTSSSVPGIQLWFDGKDPAGNGTAITPGTLSSWIDKSGNGKNGTAVNSPTIGANGRVSFGFSPNAYFTTNYTLNTQRETGFFVIVLSGNTFASYTTVINVAGGTSLNGRQVNIYCSGNGFNSLSIGGAYGFGPINTTVNIPVNIPVLISYTLTTTTLTYYFNGTQFAQYTGTFPFASTLTNIGLSGPQYFLSEVILFNTILTTAQIQLIHGYLLAKWNISNPLYLPPPMIPASGTAAANVFTTGSTTISGLQLWLDGADPAATGTPPATGAVVSSWVDKSGSSKNGSGISSPTFVAGGGILLNGTSQYYTTSLIGYPEIETGFIVVSFNALYGGQDLISGTSGAREFLMFGNQSNNAFTSIYFCGVGVGNSALLSRPLPIISGTKYILSYTTTRASRNVFFNGVNVMTGTPANYFAGPSTTNIGAYSTPANNFLNGVVYETMIFNTVLSDANRLAVETYLNTKWNVYVPNTLKLWLDSSDPYANGTSAAPNASISRWADKSANTNDAGSLVLWLDACDVNATGIPNNGSTSMTAWRDKSGYGYDAVASTAVYSGTTYPNLSINVVNNSLPVVQIQGNSGTTIPCYFDAPIPPGTFTNEFHVFMVYQYAATSGTPTYTSLFSRGNTLFNTANGNPFDMWSASGTTNFFFGNTGSFAPTVAYNLANTSYSILSINVSQTANYAMMYVNGTAIYAGGSPWLQSDLGNRFTIGSRLNRGTGFNGNIGEILVFNTAFNANQRVYIEGYLASKWGLQASLPGGHVYGINTNFGSPRLGPIISTTRPNSLMVWLDGNDPLASGTPPASGTAIPTWYDKSGNGNNGSAIGTTPTYSVGIAFSGANYYSLPDFAFPYGNSAYTYIIVSGTNTLSGSVGILGGGAPSTDSCVSIRYQGTVPPNIITYWYFDDTSSIAPVLASTTYIYTSAFTPGGACRLYINGQTDTIRTPTGVRAQPPLNNTVGKTVQAEFMNGKIYEVLVFNYELTTAQRQLMEGYLAKKWSIGLAGGAPVAATSIPPIPTTKNPGSNSLILWLDGSDPFGTGAPPNNTNVATFMDKSGYNNHLTQPTLANQPYYFNGAVQFNTGNTPVVAKIMNIPTSVFNNKSSFTLFFVFTPNQATNMLIGQYGTSSLIYLTMTQYVANNNYSQGVSNKVYWTPYQGASLLTSGSTYTTGTQYLMSMVYDGATTTLYQNGALDASLAAVQNLKNAWPVHTYLGSGEGSVLTTNFNLYSMLVYKTALNTDQRQTVEGYLSLKYNVNLTATHPYYYRKPAWIPTAPLPTGLSFDGTSQYLVSPLSAIPSAESGFFVITAPIIAGDLMAGTPNSPIVVNLTTPAYNLNNRELSINNARFYSGVENAGQVTLGYYSVSPTALNVFSYTYTPGVGTSIYFNGSLIASDTTTKNYIGSGQTTLGCYVAQSTPAGFYGGTMYEIMMFDAALGDSDRKTIEAYLAAKWNVQLSYTSIDDTFTSARFNTLNSIATDASNNLYIADSNVLRYMTIQTGFVETISGNGTASNVPGVGSNAFLTSPLDISLSNGTPYITAQGTSTISTMVFNYNNGTLIKALQTTGNAAQTNFNASSNISTQLLAAGITTGTIFASGSTAVNTPTFTSLYAISCDSNNTIYVGDYVNIRSISSSGAVTTLVGQPGNFSLTPSTGPSGSLNSLGGGVSGVCTDNSGNIYFTQNSLRTLMKFSNGTLTTLMSGSPFNNVRGMVYDGSRYIYIANYSGTNTYGEGNIIQYDTSGNTFVVIGGSTVGFNPSGILSVALNPNKTILYVADNNNFKIWQIALPALTITNYASVPVRPYVLTCDGLGNLFVGYYLAIYKIPVQAPIATLFAGTETPGTPFISLGALTTDTNNNIYVSDSAGYKVWRITQSGVITTYSGTGVAGKNDTTYVSSLSLIGNLNVSGQIAAPQGFTGSVGVNCNTPQYTLDVAGTAHANVLNIDGDMIAGTSSRGAFLRMTTAGGATYIQSGTALVSGYTAPATNMAPIYFTGMFGGNTMMTVAYTGVTMASNLIVNGNVGIGTSPSVQLLSIVGSGSYGTVYLKGTANETAIMFNDPTNASPVAGYTGWFVGQTTNWGTASNTFNIGRLSGGAAQAYNGLFIASNGSVGIGTPGPAARLHVCRDVPYSNVSANRDPYTYSQVQIAQINGSGLLYVASAYTSGVGVAGIIQSSDYYAGGDHGAHLLLNPKGGNVGINCNLPAAQLDVRGTANFSSNVTFSAYMSVFNSNITGYYNGSGISYGAGAYNTLVHTVGNLAGYMIADYGFLGDSWNFTVNAFTNNGAWVVPNGANQSSRMSMSGAGIGFYVSAGGGTAPTTQRVGIGNGVSDYTMNVYGRAFMSSIAFKSTYNDFINGAPSYGIGQVTSGLAGLGTYLVASNQAPLQIANYHGINFVAGPPWNAGSSHMCIVDAKVGIATTTPAANLDILGGNGNTGTGGTNLMAFQYVGGGYRHFITSRHIGAANNSGNAIDFWINNSATAAGSSTAGTGNVNMMSVTATGVGINTNAPGYNLDVVGNGHFSGNLFVDADLVVYTTNQYCRITGDNAGTAFFANNAYLNANKSAWFAGNSGYGGTNYSYTMYMNPAYSTGGFVFAAAAYPQGTANISSYWQTVFQIYENGNATLQKVLTQNSDIRLKENIVTLESCLDKVKSLRGVYFTRKDTPGKRQIGFIAQEVEQILPEVVLEDMTKEKIKSIAYQNVVPVLVEAIKEQQTMITTLQNQVAAQQSTITGILARLG